MPPKAKRPTKGKRYPLNMRTTKELREQIEAAARASGRSLVQEVEYRLDRSFDAAGVDALMGIMGTLLIDDEAEGTKLLRLVMRALYLCRGWPYDSKALEQLQTAVCLLIEGCAKGSLTAEDISAPKAVGSLEGRTMALSLFNSNLRFQVGEDK